MVEAAPSQVFGQVQGVVAEIDGFLANPGAELVELFRELALTADLRVLPLHGEHFTVEKFLDRVLELANLFGQGEIHVSCPPSPESLRLPVRIPRRSSRGPTGAPCVPSQRRGDDASPSGAHRVPQGTGAAVHVDVSVGLDPEFLHPNEGHHGKGLVDLHEFDLIHLEFGPLQGLAGGRDDRVAHDPRVTPRNSHGADGGNGLPA